MRLPVLLSVFVFVSAPDAVAQLGPAQREVTGFSQLYIQSIDLVDTASDDSATLEPGAFVGDLDVVAAGFFNSVTSRAEQTSDVDPETGRFEAAGRASTALYIQGEATALASSRFEVTLALPDGGVLELDELVLDVADVLGTEFSFDRPGDATASVRLVDAARTVVYEAALELDASGTEQTFDDSPVLFLGAGVYTFSLVADSSDVEPAQTQVDGSFAVASYVVAGEVVAAWSDLGFALPGAGVAPTLDGSGEPSAGGAITISLVDLPPATTTTLVVGFAPVLSPFRGGTLVPSPDVLIQLPTGAGAVSLPTVWPAGVPQGISTWLQAWTPDATAPKGLSASNGLRVVAL